MSFLLHVTKGLFLNRQEDDATSETEFLCCLLPHPPPPAHLKQENALNEKIIQYQIPEVLGLGF